MSNADRPGATVWDYDDDLPATGHEHAAAGGVDLMAQIAIHLGTIAGHVKNEQRRRERQAERWAGFPDIGGAGVFPSTAGQNLVIDCGSPPQGFIWQIRHVMISGPTIGVAAPGSAYSIIQGQPPAAFNTPFSNVFDIANTIPLPAFYGTRQYWIDGGDHLWVVVVNGTAGLTYQAQATAEQWREEDWVLAEFGE